MKIHNPDKKTYAKPEIILEESLEVRAGSSMQKAIVNLQTTDGRQSQMTVEEARKRGLLK
ncbi:hypothetical protein COX08_04480 [Candidatus Beckwithbacteria bacterium CG23_combo_of_CG06-09_8_20_14_all_34_8]|uniref:Uncharacterized protein n=1 Tax=Candidatus Beckwithbacteria bacterium CG23_combo_of_CG06-09_8_20_14_all_34_8 TaxID=1974497 RepID=A0A2H0B570_9BACT|nr:MAG: hypothetical protein COX08_04480 [Candidatus Beckwithbacteria bacterium CG23_combo_of_CG06-09_8_20_14_all_34_8]